MGVIFYKNTKHSASLNKAYFLIKSNFHSPIFIVIRQSQPDLLLFYILVQCICIDSRENSEPVDNVDSTTLSLQDMQFLLIAFLCCLALNMSVQPVWQLPSEESIFGE
jgi:hypothetical protein